MKNQYKHFILIMLLALLTIISCNKENELNCLAVKNLTNNTLDVEVYYKSFTKPSNYTVLPNEYTIFYQNSADSWIYPNYELKKVCDSIVFFSLGKRISFSEHESSNFCKSPFGELFEWDKETSFIEVPQLIGFRNEKKHIYTINIEENCIY